jgi:hypothetical protein
MPPPDSYLLPSTVELEPLTDGKVKLLVGLADNANRRGHAYAIFGMACGTVSFLGSLGAYVYLVESRHEAAAGIVLGTGVLAIVGRMIRGK